MREDQCIFIRGFRVARVFGILPRQLRGAAGPNPDLDGHGGEPDMELIPIPAVTKVKYSVRHFLVAFIRAFKYQDPLHLLLEYVAEVSTDDPSRVYALGSNMDYTARDRLRYGPCPR